MLSSQQHMPRVNIIVADDHPVVVLGISKMLDEINHLHLVAAATTIYELFESLAQVHCDILICDYSFEDDEEPDGLLLLERIRRLYPEIKIIVLTGHDDLVVVQRVMQIGVAGFLSKISMDFSVLHKVIQRVLSGEKYLDPGTSKMLIQHMIANDFTTQTLSTTQLSARELEVVRMFARGMSVTDIALHTDRSVKTISTQKKKAMLKLGAENDIELVNAFNRLS